jgi:K+-transporting ATPase KdpF subunit
MNIWLLIALVLALGVGGYLIYALLKAEDFT